MGVMNVALILSLFRLRLKFEQFTSCNT